jgi:hypothetical protein
VRSGISSVRYPPERGSVHPQGMPQRRELEGGSSGRPRRPSGAANGWSESLRQEVLPDVRVTLIEPGVVASELPKNIAHAETRDGVQQLV